MPLRKSLKISTRNLSEKGLSACAKRARARIDSPEVLRAARGAALVASEVRHPPFSGAPVQASHQGARPVRKSVSVQGDTATLPSWTEVCASARDRGAGPRTTLPFSSYCEPWQGQMNLFEDRTQGTTQPRCVQTALSAKSLMPVSVLMR